MGWEHGKSLSASPAFRPTNRRQPLERLHSGLCTSFNDHTFEYTAGLNWYPNYWVKYVVNLGIDQLKEPSIIGVEPQNYFVVTAADCSSGSRFGVRFGFRYRVQSQQAR